MNKGDKENIDNVELFHFFRENDFIVYFKKEKIFSL